ncbi:hypothetical protein [Shouchella clausii]|uniref:Uncharacterized protein n=1 Tax=Shouchella clausii TaxID=79880 RepID=A0A268P589_SHOCL|nr:hypothetical protein [Shouchella clausii]PAE90906.1 hypothetical protein CHH72_00360 [Shouchella clausii]
MNSTVSVKEALRGLIEIYENDFSHGYQGNDKEVLDKLFLKLIVAVTRFAQGIRYCGKIECRCSPESNIKFLVEANYDTIMGNLLAGDYGLSEVPLSRIRDFLDQFRFHEVR